MRVSGIAASVLCAVGLSACDETTATSVFETFEAHCMRPALDNPQRMKGLQSVSSDVAVPFMAIRAAELKAVDQDDLRIFDFTATNETQKHDLNCGVYAEKTDPDAIRQAFLAQDHYAVQSVINMKGLPIDGTGVVFFFSSTLHGGGVTALMIREGQSAILFSNFPRN